MHTNDFEVYILQCKHFYELKIKLTLVEEYFVKS